MEENQQIQNQNQNIKKITFRKNPNISKKLGLEIRKNHFDMGNYSKKTQKIYIKNIKKIKKI